MDDQYIANQVGVMGKKAGKNAIIIQQSSEQKINSTDFSTLTQEIAKIRQYLGNNSDMDVDFKDVITGNLAEINLAVKDKNSSKIFDCLKRGGKELYNIARNLGCSVLARYIANLLGL